MHIDTGNMDTESRPSKLPTTMRIVARALAKRLFRSRRRTNDAPRRILVAHQLPIGDTLMLTPLLAKLREQFPESEIVLITSIAMAPLYQTRPYGVIALPFNPRDLATLPNILSQSGFDLAIVPGDNRHAWLAAALDSRWIVAHAGDRPAVKNWMIDESIPYPSTATAMGDMFAELAGGPAPKIYDPKEWRLPVCAPFARPRNAYAVLHVGASGQMKRWGMEKWRAIAHWLNEQKLTVVWSAGTAERKLVQEIDPAGIFQSLAGNLDLPQLWNLIAHAELLICPDTGAAHIARLTDTPVVILFGPGTPTLFGAGRFWKKSPYVPVLIEDIPCRNQHVLLRREISWASRCTRGPNECTELRCMQAISVENVIDAVKDALSKKAAAIESLQFHID